MIYEGMPCSFQGQEMEIDGRIIIFLLSEQPESASGEMEQQE